MCRRSVHRRFVNLIKVEGQREAADVYPSIYLSQQCSSAPAEAVPATVHADHVSLHTHTQ